MITVTYRLAILARLLTLLNGCHQFDLQEYTPFTRALDGNSELHISTYPAGFAKIRARVPYLYRKLESHPEVFFKVSIGDRETRAGPNRHVDTIRIDSFAYRFDGAPTVLLSAYESNFWMQDQHREDALPASADPIPFHSEQAVLVDIELTLNNEKFSFSGEMEPRVRSSRAPLFLVFR
ncbi:MAG: hypothetical protein AAF658_16560 [Myxococcota bacterium]